MKKILVIHTNYQTLGGEDVAVDNEVELLKTNYKVETLYFSNNINQYLNQFISFIFNRNKKSEKRLKEKLNAFKPDIVYVHNTWFKASLGIFKILENYPAKVILKLHNFRYDCTRSFNTNIHLRNASVCNACGQDKKSLGLFNKYYKESFILVFSHVFFMQTLISVLLGSKRVWGFKTNNTGIYEFEIEENNIQLSDEGEWIYKQDDYIALNPKKWSIIRFNDITHLKERE